MFSPLSLLSALTLIAGFIQVPLDSTGKRVATATPGAGDHRQYVVLSGDQVATEIARVLGTAVDTSDATQVYGVVTRTLLRSFGATISTTPLAGGGSFTQAWQETNLEGTSFVGLAVLADQAGNIFVEESQDSVEPLFTRQVTSSGVGANSPVGLYSVIRARYWRVRYVNGGVAQTSFRLSVVAKNVPAYSIDTGGNLVVIPAAGAVFPVSATTLPLPTGASTETTLGGIKTGTDKIPASPSQEHTTAASPSAVRLTDGAAFFKPTTPADTQPVSAASLPLPTGASTAAKQPALGTSGTPSADVITVQGAAAMTAVKVDGSAVTQPVSGTVTANIGTGNLAGITGSVTVKADTAGNQANALKVDGSAVTQPVSIAATVTVASKIALTPASPASASVGVASAQALASNANRKGLVIVNTSNATVSFGLGVAAVLNSGITLTPGGTWEMDEFTFATGAINAIASAAASNIALQEFS